MPKINYICAQGYCVEYLWVADGLARQTSATSASPQSWHDPDCTVLLLGYNYGKHSFHFHYLWHFCIHLEMLKIPHIDSWIAVIPMQYTDSQVHGYLLKCRKQPHKCKGSKCFSHNWGSIVQSPNTNPTINLGVQVVRVHTLQHECIWSAMNVSAVISHLLRLTSFIYNI